MCDVQHDFEYTQGHLLSGYDAKERKKQQYGNKSATNSRRREHQHFAYDVHYCTKRLLTTTIIHVQRISIHFLY